MFIVTNRNIRNEAGNDFDVVGETFNEKGPAELRLLEVRRKGRRWDVQVLPDTVSDAMLAEVGIKRPPPTLLDDGKTEKQTPVYASQYAFRKIIDSALAERDNPKHIVFFVHGFNNALEDVVLRCDLLAKTYGVEVVAFSWPANGGGVRGVASYLDDKRDAQASVVALDRAMDKARQLLLDLRASAIDSIIGEARKERGARVNSERFRERVSAMADADCPVRTTLMLHSMGNYLLERTLKSSALRGSLPLFDNIAICAADVNNAMHAEWIDRLQPRSRLYVTINEDDGALRASRLKGGDEQLARLGHWTNQLDSTQATYVDFTNVKRVGSSHAYFEGEPVENPAVKKFFKAVLRGLRAEEEVTLTYDGAKNLHRIA